MAFLNVSEFEKFKFPTILKLDQDKKPISQPHFLFLQYSTIVKTMMSDFTSSFESFPFSFTGMAEPGGRGGGLRPRFWQIS